MSSCVPPALLCAADRHRAILRDRVWGDGDAEGARQRASEELRLTARVAKQLGVNTVVGFTGSAIWPYVAVFPPVPDSVIDAGYEDFAARWNPILDFFDSEGIRFALEVYPSEIAYDYRTSIRTLDAIKHRTAFGFNWTSHMLWQGIDPLSFITDFADRIFHVDFRDTRLRAERTERDSVVPPGLGKNPSSVGFRVHWTRRRPLGGLVRCTPLRWI